MKHDVNFTSHLTCNFNRYCQNGLIGCIFALFLVSLQSCISQDQQDVSEKAGQVAFSKLPEFKGDVYEYIAANAVYPAQSIANNKEGNVLVYFKVDELGVISNINTVSGGTDPALVQAALDCMAGMPAWSPAEKNGRKVVSDSRLTFAFRLSSDKTNIVEELSDEEYQQGLAQLQEDMAQMRKNRQSGEAVVTSAEDEEIAKKVKPELTRFMNGEASGRSHKYITPHSSQKS